tara:strand:- start:3480 stop:4040 length:561 start_codon:yes stop_codon:yes gene_type:complete
MTRTLVSTIVSEVSSATVYPVFMAQFEFGSGNLNLWTGYRNLTVGSDVFVGAGELGSITPIIETETVVARGLDFTLSGIDTSIISTALTENYHDRICTLWIGFMSSANAFIDRVQMFKGRMDTMNITEGPETATITVAAESVLVSLERANERRFTSEDQKLINASDKGYDQVPSLQNLEVAWGKTT